jgi:hypothetical protein
MATAPSLFARKNLMPDEHFVRQAEFSWVYTFNACFVCLICVFLGYIGKHELYIYTGIYQPYVLYAGAGFGLWLFYALMIKKWTTEIILTTERLIYKRGLFMVTVSEVDIEQLASDSVQQNFIGRIFNYGEIHIRCVEADDILLPPIDKPYEFRNALEQQKHNFREHYMKVERLRHEGRGPDDK